MHEGKSIFVARGDYSPLLARVNAHLAAARDVAANDTQRGMLADYIRSFDSGLHDAHVEGSRKWIHDKGPVVESYIGFIEVYRDPMKSRGEWEGFVAVVDKEASAKLGALVDAAEGLLSLMPWPRAFDKVRTHTDADARGCPVWRRATRTRTRRTVSCAPISRRSRCSRTGARASQLG
jgi:dipeptidyl-peptidase-3